MSRAREWAELPASERATILYIIRTASRSHSEAFGGDLREAARLACDALRAASREHRAERARAGFATMKRKGKR